MSLAIRKGLKLFFLFFLKSSQPFLLRNRNKPCIRWFYFCVFFILFNPTFHFFDKRTFNFFKRTIWRFCWDTTRFTEKKFSFTNPIFKTIIGLIIWPFPLFSAAAIFRASETGALPKTYLKNNLSSSSFEYNSTFCFTSGLLANLHIFLLIIPILPGWALL